jgi:hypothetical protein
MDTLEKLRFNALNVDDAPAATGVYVLYEARRGDICR